MLTQGGGEGKSKVREQCCRNVWVGIFPVLQFSFGATAASVVKSDGALFLCLSEAGSEGMEETEYT